MSELKTLLDRALEGLEPAHDALERTLDRVVRRRRRRVAARVASVTVLVVAAAAAALIVIPSPPERRITTRPAQPVVPPRVQAVTTLPVLGGLTDIALGDGSLWVPGSDV